MFFKSKLKQVIVAAIAACSSTACDGGEPMSELTPHVEALEPSCGVTDAGPEHPDANPEPSKHDCHVTLSKVSYDSPGADDSELIELRVDGIDGPRTTPIKLGDCGAQSLELVNGGGATCSVYRRLDLAELVAPESGYLVICSSESRLATSGVCDVVSASGAPLKNGWLQNGPSDGIRLLGASPQAWSYEGIPGACSNDDWIELATDTGVAIDGADDIIANCSGSFVRLSSAAAPLHTEALCPINAIEAGVTADSGYSAPSNDAQSTAHKPSPGSAPKGSIEIQSESIEIPDITKGSEVPNDAGKPSQKSSDSDAGQYPSRSFETLAPGCRAANVALSGSYPLSALMLMTLSYWRRRQRRPQA